jgi:hypothetical protein
MSMRRYLIAAWLLRRLVPRELAAPLRHLLLGAAALVGSGVLVGAALLAALSSSIVAAAGADWRVPLAIAAGFALGGAVLLWAGRRLVQRPRPQTRERVRW